MASLVLEPFINNAVAWSLREYSKVNPLWVKAFINKYNKGLNNSIIKKVNIYLNK